MWLHITVAYTASGIGAMAKADSGISAASRPIDRLVDVEIGGRCRLAGAAIDFLKLSPHYLPPYLTTVITFHTPVNMSSNDNDSMRSWSQINPLPSRIIIITYFTYLIPLLLPTWLEMLLPTSP